MAAYCGPVGSLCAPEHAPGFAPQFAFDFERRNLGRYDGGFALQVANELIFRHRRRSQTVEDLSMQFRCTLREGSLLGRALGRLFLLRCRGRQGFDHVTRPPDQGRTIPDQHITPGPAGVIRVTGDSEHIPALIERGSRCDQTTAFRRGFHDDDGLRKARDNSVPAREMARKGLHGHGDLAEAQTFFFDSLAENRIL